jgi:allophanate hydrolase
MPPLSPSSIERPASPEAARARCAAYAAEDPAIWILLLSPEQVAGYVARSDAKAGAAQPLKGLTFAIKDNIDLAGVPTTAACPDFAYTAERDATVVARLLAAGAIPLGKTNLDQFATGLVGTRSPYGVPRNPHHPAYIPGGSSSGSAVAVAAGLCDFALGTDTAGSGRIPAGLNNLVGLKPTRGLLSSSGLLPACRTLDCISLFTRTVAEAAKILPVVSGYDESDPYSRSSPLVPPSPVNPLRIGVPRADQLEFFGNDAARALFDAACQRWRDLGATLVEVDFSPFLEAANLLYAGPWVAERYAAIRKFIESRPEALHPVTRQIIAPAVNLRTVDAFQAMYRLAELRRAAEQTLSRVDVLLTPTAGTAYTVEQVMADPIRTNSNLGRYTNYMNLFDLCGIALPAGKLPDNVPWGITLVAPAFHDLKLLQLAALFTGETLPSTVATTTAEATHRVAVCGAHLSGLPLNGQLLSRGARLVRATHTAPQYRLSVLPDTVPPKPGLVRVNEGGASIAVEVWELPLSQFGSFVAAIPPPLGIGTVTLADGEQVQGFLCEASATGGARDITHLGSWREFLRQNS